MLLVTTTAVVLALVVPVASASWFDKWNGFKPRQWRAVSHSSTTTTVKPTTTTVKPTTTTVKPTTTTTTTTTAPAPPPSSSGDAPSSPPVTVCSNRASLAGPSSPPAGAVVVPAGDNSSTIGTDWNIAANTTYYLAAGVHTLGTSQFSQIIPKDGDKFIGAPGAILDGKGLNNFAFTQHATNVTISNLEIRGFNAPHDQGVVNHDSGNGWTVTRNYIHDNHGAALMTGSNNVVTYNCLDHNGQYGINAAGLPSPSNLLLDHNEISRNDADDVESQIAGCGCTGGVKFWDVNGATVTNNYVHDNLSVGLWADTNDRAMEFAGNYISDNWGEGLLYEISYNAYIHDNTFIRNALKKGPTNPGFPTGAIYVSESGGDSRVAGGKFSTLEISNNVFTDNYTGVILWENADRFCGSPANSSSGYCTLVNTGVVNINTCNATNIAKQPYISDCRWKTQNVSVHDNVFNMNPANIPGCTVGTNGCGFSGVFSNAGSVPSWSPYRNEGIRNAITYSQNNKWFNNTYHGSWRFMPFDQAHQVPYTTWRGSPYAQDAGSTMSP